MAFSDSNHTGSMIALVVPDPEIYAINPQTPDSVPADELHITLGYLGKAEDISPSEREAVLEAVQVLADTSNAPEALFPATSGVFPVDPESKEENPKAPYIAQPANSERFSALREELMIHLSARGVSHLVSTKYPVFIPHVTLTYAPLDEAPDLSYLPTPLPVRFSTLIVTFGGEVHTFELGTPNEGAELPLTASVRHSLKRMAATSEVSEDYLTALYLRQRQVKATPSQTRAQAALAVVASAIGSTLSPTPYARIQDLTDRISLEPSPEGKLLLASRALALAARTAPPTDPTTAREFASLTASLRALTADGNSRLARSLRARRQLRDRYGRWIEMGGGVRFKVRAPGTPGGGTWYHGQVVSLDIPNGRVGVELEDGRIVQIPNNKLEQPKAILGMKLGEKLKKFAPKSANRKGGATSDSESAKLDSQELQAQIDADFIDGMNELMPQLDEQKSSTPKAGTITGGHVTALVDQKQVRDALDSANGAPTVKVTGNKEPFKNELDLDVANANKVRAALDHYQTQYLPEGFDDLSDEEKAKARSTAAGNAIAHLGGLYNDSSDESAAELRKAPSVGTDADLEEIDPSAITPSDEEVTDQDLINATNDAFAELSKRIPDDSPLSSVRDQIGAALKTANDRFAANSDDREVYLDNLDAIKNFANEQEPVSGATPEHQAFSAFAEDIDDVHASVGGVDKIDEAKAVLDKIKTVLDSDYDDSDQPAIQPIKDVLESMDSAFESGSYMENPSEMRNDFLKLSDAVEKSDNLSKADSADSEEIVDGIAKAISDLPTPPESDAPETDADAPASLDDADSYVETGTTEAHTASLEAFSKAASDAYAYLMDEDGNFKDLGNRELNEIASDYHDSLNKWYDVATNPESSILDWEDAYSNVEVDGTLLSKALADVDPDAASAIKRSSRLVSHTSFDVVAEKQGNTSDAVPSTSQKLNEVHANIEDLAEDIPETDPVHDVVATSANVIANIAKDMAQGKITPEEAQKLIEGAMKDLNDHKNDSPEFTDEVEDVVDEIADLQTSVGNDAQSYDPQHDDLSGEQREEFNDMLVAAEDWFEKQTDLLFDEPDFEEGQGAGWEAPQQAQNDFAKFQASVLNSSYKFQAGNSTRAEYLKELDQALTDWHSSDGFGDIGYWDEDGHFATVFDGSETVESLQDALADSNFNAEAPSNETPEIPETLAKAISEVDLEGSGLPDETSEEMADWEKELLDIPTNLSDLPEEDLKDVAAKGNLLIDKLDEIIESEQSSEEEKIAAAGLQDKIEDIVDALESSADEMEESLLDADPVDTPGSPVADAEIQNVINAMQEQGSPMAKMVGSFLQSKLDNGEPLTDNDFDAMQEFMETLSGADTNSPEDVAEITNVADALDLPEAPEAPEAPALETPSAETSDYNAPDALELDDALNSWGSQLNDYLAKIGNANVNEVIAGTTWNELSKSQRDNIADIASKLPKSLGDKLNQSLNAHVAGDITDDALIQSLNNVLFDVSAKSPLHKRIAGAQQGIQVNASPGVPVLRPQPEKYKKGDSYEAHELELASPEVVHGSIQAILNQSASGADLKHITGGDGSTDEQVKTHIENASAALVSAIDSFGTADVSGMVSKMREALDAYDEAIALRKGVAVNDKIIRRLRARRRRLDETLAAFEGRWPDSIRGGNKEAYSGSWNYDKTEFHLDKMGNKVYPGDRVERTHGEAKGQLGTLIGWRGNSDTGWQGQFKFDQENKTRDQGVSDKVFILSAVGPNNPLYNDPDYTGPRIDDEHLEEFNTIFDKKAAKKAKKQEKAAQAETAPASEPEAPETPEVPEAPEAPVVEVAPEESEVDEIDNSVNYADLAYPEYAQHIENATSEEELDAISEGVFDNPGLSQEEKDDLYPDIADKSDEIKAANALSESVWAPMINKGQSGDGYVTTPSGKKYWGKYGAAGVAFVGTDEEGVKRVLIGKKGSTGKWQLPGGAIDELETPEQGAAREFGEETLTGKDPFVGLTDYKAHTFEDPEGTGWKYTTFVAETDMFVVEAPPGAPQNELIEFRWVTSNDLAEMDANGDLIEHLSDGSLADKVGFSDDDLLPSGPDTDMTPEAASEIDADMPDTTPVSVQTYDMSNWKKIGGSQGGSNPGALYEDENGNKFYAKKLKSQSHIGTEVLASLFYEKFGINAAHVRKGELDGESFAVSKWVDGTKSDAKTQLNTPDSEWMKEVHDGFAIDAWLGNYDVVGGGYDNLLTDAEGKPFRMDNGSSFFYTAKGNNKAWWSDEVTDLSDMKSDSWKSKETSWAYGPTVEVFKHMSDEDVRNSAKKLLTVSTDDIAELINSSPLPEPQKAEMIDTMIKRRHDILDKTGLLGANDANTPENVSAETDKGLTELKTIQQEVAAQVGPDGIPAVGAHIPSNSSTSLQVGDKVILVNGNSGTVKKLLPDAYVKVHDEAKGIDTYHSAGVLKYAGSEETETSAPAPVSLVSGYSVIKEGDSVVAFDAATSKWFEGTLAPVQPVSQDNGVQLYTVNKKFTDEPVQIPQGTIFTPEAYDLSVTSSSFDLSNISVGDDITGHTMLGPILHKLPVGSEITLTTPISGAENVATKVPSGNWEFSAEYGAVSFDSTKLSTSIIGSVSLSKLPTEGEGPTPTGLKSMAGQELHIEDWVTNKTGSKIGKVVSVDAANQKVGFHNYSPLGDPLYKKDGKPFISNYSPENLIHTTPVVTATVSDDGQVVEAPTPTATVGKPVASPSAAFTNSHPEVIYSEGDPSHPLYGTPKPELPEDPAASADDFKYVSDEWMEKANEEYKKRQKAKYPDKAEKNIQDSSYWHKYQAIQLHASEGDLKFLLDGGYISQETHDEALSLMEGPKQAKANQIKLYAAALEEHATQMAEWRKANGLPTLKLSGPDFGLKMSKSKAKTWFNQNMQPKLNSEEWDAANNQKSSGGWKSVLYKSNKTLGLDDASIEATLKTNSPSNYQYALDTYKGIKSGAKKTPMVDAVWGIRTFSSDSFHKMDGTPFKAKDPDLQQIVGTIQKDPAVAEITPGHTQHGGSPGFVAGNLDVVMDVLIPKGMPAIWTQGTGMANAQSGENGVLMGGAVGYYIHSVEPNYTVKGTKYRWRVVAEIIPAEFVPELDHLSGSQYEPSIYKPNALIEGGIIPQVQANIPNITPVNQFIGLNADSQELSSPGTNANPGGDSAPEV